MMNKKAIAAFAAGATLLAGFAMATPAFAAEPQAPKKEECKPADAAKLAELKKAVKDADRKATKAGYDAEDAQANYDKAVAEYNAKKAIADKYDSTVKAYKADKAKADAENDQVKKAQLNVTVAQDEAAFKAAKKAADDYKDNAGTATFAGKTKDLAQAAEGDLKDSLGAAVSRADLLEAKAKKADADNELKEAKAALTKAQCTPTKPAPQPTKPGEAKPVVPGVHVKAADKAKAVEAVKTAKLHLDDAFAAYTKDYAEYEKAKATLAGKVAAQEAAEKALKAAQDALEAYNVSAKNDSVLAQRLADAVDRAQAKVVFAVAETAKANKDYAEAKAKAVASTAKYNAALAEYKACYNDAVTFGVEASKLPPVVTSDPLAPNFEDVPGAAKAMNDAASGKLGKAAQQEAGKAAAGKAAAKGELAAKGGNGHGKSGEKLGNAGVGVALTALAASMLAGMGAAVRKMRH
ncbi:hypothetical protein [Gardnerella vaginalis]|nr:hypothetical protein [Gardnerella vaginalis]UQA83128.1 hypothetical protein K9E41_04935 [Gardnerella vaginalis]